jgi:hypothetical protein
MKRFRILLASLPLLLLAFFFSNTLVAQKGDKPKGIEFVFDERAGRPIAKGQLLVTLHDGVKIDDLKPIFERMEAPFEVVGRIDKVNYYTLATDHARLPEIKQRLENHPYVASSAFNDVVEIERIFNDPIFKKPDDMKEAKDNWNLYRINAPEAWDITTGGSVVAIIDSGALMDHEELVGRTTKPYSFSTGNETMQGGMKKLKAGKGYRNEDPRNHGTHVAVTIGGQADNGVGTVGVAPRSPLMPLQTLFYVEAFPKEQAGVITSLGDNISRALTMAIDRQASVINMSLGAYNKETVDLWRKANTDLEKQDLANRLLAQAEGRAKAVAPMIDRANRSGVIIVNSAGNENIPAEFGYLTFTRRTISVAATTRDDTRAIFSNYGESTTVSAPGHEIWSGFAEPNKPYEFLSGTSMASPHATGVVSLMQSIDPTLKHADVMDILIKTGRPLETDVPIGPLINAKAAVDETRRRKKEMITMPEPPPLIQPPQVNPTLPRLPDDGIAILGRPAPWNDSNIQRIIRVWLAFAIARPPAGTDPDVRWFFNRFGQPVNNQNLLQTPRPVWFQFNFRMLWENANRLESLNMGTLFEFTAGTLRQGRFDPAPTRVPEKVRPKKEDPLPRPKGLPFDPALGKTKWEGKNAKGEPVKFDFNDKGGVTITRDGKQTLYTVKINPYAQPMLITFYPHGGGDPIRALLNLKDIGDIDLATDFTKKRPAALTKELTHALKRTDIDRLPVVAVAAGFGDGDGALVDGRFAAAKVSSNRLEIEFNSGRKAGGKETDPIIGWAIKKYDTPAAARAFVADMGSKIPNIPSQNGFRVIERTITADRIVFATDLKTDRNQGSMCSHVLVYRDFVINFGRVEPKSGVDFGTEAANVIKKSKELIELRFPPK